MRSSIHALNWLWNSGARHGQESDTKETNPNHSKIAKYGVLVLSALPALRQLSMGLFQHFGDKDKRSDCFKGIQTSAALLENYLGRIKKENNFQKYDETIIQLADCLEELFKSLQVTDPSDAGNESPFPRIQVVVSKQNYWEHSRQRILGNSSLNNLDTWKNTWESSQKELVRLTNELRPTCHGDYPDDTVSNLPEEWQTPDEKACQFLHQAFSAVLCKCEAYSTQTVRLRVGTYRQGSGKPEPKRLCILFPWREKVGEWLELLVYDERSRGIKASANRTDSKTNICNHYKKHTVLDFRLDLTLQQNCLSLSKDPPNSRTSQVRCLQQQIDLKSLLSFKEKNWSIETKWALAVILAYALLYMHGESHFRSIWRRENIVFFHDGHQIPLQPFIGMPKSPAERLHDDPIHPSIHVKHPSIVMLGVILLEIYLGQRLESFLGIDYEITDDYDLYLRAWKAYNELESEMIPTQYKKAIHACLDARIFRELEDDDEKMRSEVFRQIIKPLDEIMFETFNERDLLKLDKAIAEKYNLASGLSLPLPTLLSTETSLKQCIPEIQNPVPTSNHNQAAVDASKELPPVDGTVASTQLRIDKGSNKNMSQEPQYKSTTQAAEIIERRRIKQSDFKVAIICALTIEADAVYALFDSRLDEDDVQFDETPCDPNVYSTGTIGRHYVVLTHMANMGKVNAATVATNCSRTFPNIKLAFVVGICGAVPFSTGRTDIMLGDVIVSEGVFQYDLGRQLPREFKPKNGPNSLSRPIGNIRAALSKWKGDAWRRKLHSNMYECLSILQATSELPVQYPGALHDKLFEANYPHVDDETPCDHGCDGLRVQRRRPESSTIQPKIHFGIVASGDSVMKSGEERDRIAQKHDIIAFEMESAGVWDVLPCIVVKGACDYADSHKNKVWQSYAAITAAACMRALLDDRALSL